MGVERAIELVTLLARGIDPSTGEVVPDEHLLQKHDVIRALHLAVDALRADKRRAARRKTLPERAGAAWSEAEDKKLIEAYEAGRTDQEMAKEHQRTRGAIRSRLIHLGRLEFPADANDD